VPAPDPAALRWAVNAAAPGAAVTEVRGLRDGGSPWLVRLTRHGQDRGVVLRAATSQDPAALATEVAAVQLAAGHDIPAPRLLAADLDGDPPLVLVEQLPGSSRIPPGRPSARLRTLGRTAATLHAIALAPAAALPERDRPIASVDFAALRRQRPPDPSSSKPSDASRNRAQRTRPSSSTATSGRATPCGPATPSTA
jgi:aminoglycoside phosphotransferase